MLLVTLSRCSGGGTTPNPAGTSTTAQTTAPATAQATAPGAAGGAVAPSGSTGPATSAPVSTTDTTLGTMPKVLSTTPSAVDWRAIRSVADLADAFACKARVEPIAIKAAATNPAGIVCPSGLAGDEALYLYYAPTPDDRYLAITHAMKTAKYVHAGPNWVAAGTLSATMGTIGGDVHK
jgi:hypothetical protein